MIAVRARRARWVMGMLGLLACADRAPERGTDAPSAEAHDRDAILLASAKVALPPAGLTLVDLPDAKSEGARLVERYCTACHALPTPLTHSSADWPRVVRRMWLRMDGLEEPARVPIPSSAERTVLLRYFIEHALRVSEAGLPTGPDRPLFVAVCGRCHELPDPEQYSSAEWSAVVDRMGARMTIMLNQSLTPTERSRIAGYLEGAAGARANR